MYNNNLFHVYYVIRHNIINAILNRIPTIGYYHNIFYLIIYFKFVNVVQKNVKCERI